MKKIIDWVKVNKLTAFLLIVVLWFAFRSFLTSFFGFSTTRIALKNIPSSFNEVSEFQAGKAIGGLGNISIPSIPSREAAPAPEIEDRLVVQTSNLSLLVADVQKTADEIVDYVQDQGGYMVDTTLTHPQESPYGTVTIRIPSDKLQESLSFLRSLAIKVTSEHLLGTDVTDEYVDIGARLETLNKTKAKFEEILEKAIRVEDILQVQREIINLQERIDSLKGRQKYLEQTAKMAKITIYLSTDELALPYAPSETFRPKVIFKLAVRSLIQSLRKVSAVLIWLSVYAIIWLPILIIVFIVNRYRRPKRPS